MTNTIWTLGAGAAVVLDDARRFGLAEPISVDFGVSHRVQIQVRESDLSGWAEYLEADVTPSEPFDFHGRQAVNLHADAVVFDVPVRLIASTTVVEQVPA